MVSSSRLGTALAVALLVSFTLDAFFSPPDPFTQLFFVSFLLVVALPGAYFVLGRDPSRREHALFVVALAVLAFAGVAALDAAGSGPNELVFRTIWVAVALLVAGWLAHVEGEALFDAVGG